MSDAEALVEVVERVRRSQYPDLPGTLVKDIIEIQVRFQEDQAEAARHTRNAIVEEVRRELGADIKEAT